MKFQNCILINFELTHDKPKAICPFNFSKVGGIKTSPPPPLVAMTDQDKLGRVAQSVMCLATDVSLTADPGVVSLIPARSHTCD